jgi:hypothetical protein
MGQNWSAQNLVGPGSLDQNRGECLRLLAGGDGSQIWEWWCRDVGTGSGMKSVMR